MISLHDVECMSADKLTDRLNPTVLEAGKELVCKAYEAGIPILITQGFRSFYEQTELYKKGRTEPGQIVTNAQAGESYHNYGLAIDFALLNHEGSRALWDTYADLDNDGERDWMEVVRIAKNLGFEWGGDWSSFKDYPHFQMSFGLSINDLQRGMTPPDHPTYHAVSDGTLEQGDRGPDVKAVQHELNVIGHYDLTEDGIYGRKTAAAVRSFQEAQHIHQDGIVGPVTRAHLKDALEAIKEANAILECGDKGDQVETLQHHLKKLGYDLAADGIFGPRTEATVKHFQSWAGITIDGKVGPETRKAIHEAFDFPGHNIKEGDHGKVVKQVQRKVNVKADGRFGPITKEAVKSFQRDHHLVQDGIVGPKTWAKMF